MKQNKKNVMVTKRVRNFLSDKTSLLSNDETFVFLACKAEYTKLEKFARVTNYNIQVHGYLFHCLSFRKHRTRLLVFWLQ